MSPETARALGYAEGKAAARLAMIRGAANRGIEVHLEPERDPIFVGRCRLCGEPARGAYCRGHQWAYGSPDA